MFMFPSTQALVLPRLYIHMHTPMVVPVYPVFIYTVFVHFRSGFLLPLWERYLVKFMKMDELSLAILRPHFLTLRTWNEAISKVETYGAPGEIAPKEGVENRT